MKTRNLYAKRTINDSVMIWEQNYWQQMMDRLGKQGFHCCTNCNRRNHCTIDDENGGEFCLLWEMRE